MNNYYKEKLEQGIEFQDFVFEKFYDIGIPLISYSSKKYQVMKGENKAGIEIKNDTLFKKTGNFYIEVAEKGKAENKNFIESGIYRNDNSWLYVIGDYEDIYIFSKYQLRSLYENIDKYQLKEKEIPTSKGFLLPVNFKNGLFVLRHIKISE